MKPFQTKDSTLSYYISQLDNLDKKLHQPLMNISWSRDVTLRTGISLANESTSFLRSSFAAPGTLSASGGNVNGGGIPWVGPETTTIPGIDLNGERIIHPLRLFAREISYTSVELDRAALLGMDLDSQKMDALNKSIQFNTDQMVYIGSKDVGATGLLNDPLVPTFSVSGGTWATKLASGPTGVAAILADINTALTATWTSTAYQMTPSKLGLPPAQYALLASTLISSAGNNSVLKYLADNTIALSNNGKALDIVPMKWLVGRGAGGSDRMIVYTNDNDLVRYPMVPVRRETAYYTSIRYIAPYLGAFGELEVVYPESMAYYDGI